MTRQSYKFRGLPCNIQPDSLLWCVSGAYKGIGSGVLEWCYDEDDANYRLSLMKTDPRMANLHAHKFLN